MGEGRNERYQYSVFLSDYKQPVTEDNPRGAKERTYSLDGSDNKKYIGTQTNDAPIRFLIEQARIKQGRIKRILCITSYKVITEPEPGEGSQFERFKRLVNGLLKDDCQQEDGRDQVEYVRIPYDYDGETEELLKDTSSLPVSIYERLTTCFKEITEGEEVYIDYTGGLRDISF